MHLHVRKCTRREGRAWQVFYPPEAEVNSPMRAGEWNFTPLDMTEILLTSKT